MTTKKHNDNGDYENNNKHYDDDNGNINDDENYKQVEDIDHDD
jgi:hypothetical protein